MPVTIDDVVARLRRELAEAQRELAEFAEEAAHPPEVELGGGSPGYSTWQAAVVLRKHFEHRIAELEAAIGRAEQGLYGICESCGQAIPAERLDALPFATHCVPCAGRLAGRARR